MLEAELAIEHGADGIAEPEAPRGRRREPRSPAPAEPDRREQRRQEKEAAKRAKEQDGRRATKEPVAEKQHGPIRTFFSSVRKELRKVQWPDRDTLVQASAVTLLFVAVAAAYLGVLDAIFSRLVDLSDLVRSPPSTDFDPSNQGRTSKSMFRWYVINTYSGHENKVKHNLEHRVQTMGQARQVRQVVVPTEQVQEIKDGRKVNVEKRTMPGYVLVQMEMTDEAWGLVKNTPGVTGFVGSRNKPLPLSQTEVDNLLHTETPGTAAAGAGGGSGAVAEPRARSRAPSTRSARPSRSSPARSPTSPARSPRSTTTRRSSRSWSRSSVARPRSRSATTRSRRSEEARDG